MSVYRTIGSLVSAIVYLYFLCFDSEEFPLLFGANDILLYFVVALLWPSI